MITLRDARAEDASTISDLLTRTFGGPDEAALTERIRAADGVQVELVAGVAGRGLAGHILLSDLCIAGDGRIIAAAALAPLAVDPAWQRQGIGTALVEAALACARDAGTEAVFVLGEPDFYQRFGFTTAAARPFEAPFGPPHFMALAIRERALDIRAGRVAYPPAFGL